MIIVFSVALTMYGSFIFVRRKSLILRVFLSPKALIGSVAAKMPFGSKNS
jgi:hypothetical protein